MTCKLCLEHKPLVEAHIIPRSFFVARGENRPGRLLSSAQAARAKRLPQGPYDQRILCGDCESRFSRWDDDGYKLLEGGGLAAAKPVIEAGIQVAIRLETYDYKSAKLFFLSVLWRASVSEHAFYSKVRLGPLANELREALLHQNPGDSGFFAVTLARFEDDPRVTLDPHSGRYGDVRYYNFYLSNFIATIKADRRVGDPALSRVAMAPDEPLVVISRVFSESNELRVAQRLVGGHIKARIDGSRK